MKIFVVANQKGGVGKTTTSINIAANLALKGKKVLLIDLDPQANSTSGIGYKKVSVLARENKSPSIYDVLIGNKRLSDVFVTTIVKNLFLVPSGLDLAGAEVELINMLSRETLLRKAIKAFNQPVDYVIVDSPPSLGLLTINALVAADYVLIPVQCEYFALEGLGQLLETVQMVKGINEDIKIGGVVLTMYDSRTKLSEQVAKDIKKHLSDKVFDTIIPRNIRLSEAPSYGKPIELYDPKSKGAKSYKKLTDEIVKRFK